MPTSKKVIDQYANLAAMTLTEAVAGTLITAKFNFPFSIMDKMGLIINRIEYTLDGVTNLNGAGDRITAGVCVASALSDAESVSDPLIVDSVKAARADFGAAASGVLYVAPVMKDFSSMPGGGLLVAPSPLYAYVQSVGAAGACGCKFRMYYTYIEMSADEYWQLVESRRIITNS